MMAKMCPILSKVVPSADPKEKGDFVVVDCCKEGCEAWRENPPGYGYCKLMEKNK